MTESGKRLLEGLRLHGGHDTGFCDWRPEPHIAAIEAEAVAARNAEIAAAVRALKPETLGVKTSVGFYRLRASVLAIIEGRG